MSTQTTPAPAGHLWRGAGGALVTGTWDDDPAATPTSGEAQATEGAPVRQEESA